MGMFCLGKCCLYLLLGIGLNNLISVLYRSLNPDFLIEEIWFPSSSRLLYTVNIMIKRKTKKPIISVLNLFLTIKDLNIHGVPFHLFIDVYPSWNTEKYVWNKIVFHWNT